MQDSPDELEDAEQHAGDRVVDVAVGEHHGRRLCRRVPATPASFVGGHVRDVPAGGGAAGEGHAAHQRVADQRLAHHRAPCLLAAR